uniref:Palmitoyltransferase n=1 Tax=Arion vulgaris TaxID=1028688 RepID=A0A0B7A395_9EUPU
MEDSDLLPQLINTIPGSLEMDRDEFRAQTHHNSESLSHKLREHYRKRIGNLNTDEMPSSFPSQFANRLAVSMYLFTMFSTLKIGLLDVMPLIYQGHDEIVLLQQCIVCFIFTEVMINWLGIRYVSSSYREYIGSHGGKHMNNSSLPEYLWKQQKLTKDSSAAVIMPLVTETGQVIDVVSKKYASLDTDGQSAHKILMCKENDLVNEAARVNQWMYTMNEQMNSRSISDLINVSEDNRSNLSSSEPEQQNPSKLRMNDLMSPKPVIRRDGNIVTESYPYWSWVPCYICGTTRPPRCHHCPLCKTCVLKRDHHCFFAGSCIGYQNHRFFITFLFWAWVGCVYATIHGFPYIRISIWVQISYFDIFFPVAVLRFLFGYLSFHSVLTVTTLSFLIAFDVFTAFYLYLQCRLLSLGLTSFERSCLKSSLEIKDTRKLNQKIRAVFGRYWLLNFLFPTYLILKPEEDPISWPDVRIIKH